MPHRPVVTHHDIVAGLDTLGVRRGDVVLVHASMSQFGLVVGGAHTLYTALRERVGVGGTLVMPSFTPQLCHPATWRSSDLAPGNTLRAAVAMPAFDVARTPAARSMGVLSEMFRAMPDTARSTHPHVSFVSEGSYAADIVREHPLEYRLSMHSPLGPLWHLDATILMLGTPWSKCTALHLAEYDAAYPGRRRGLWPVPEAGQSQTRWREVPELLVWEGDFDAAGAAYEVAHDVVATAHIGAATCRALRLRPLARYASRWFRRYRDLRRGIAPPGWTQVIDAIDPLPPGIRLPDDEPSSERGAEGTGVGRARD